MLDVFRVLNAMPILLLAGCCLHVVSGQVPKALTSAAKNTHDNERLLPGILA